MNKKNIYLGRETLWKRGDAYFFSVGEDHTAILIPMGGTAMVVEYWMDDNNKTQHAMSIMSPPQWAEFKDKFFEDGDRSCPE